MAPAQGRIRIGCSGWQYKHWRGDLYPADLPQSRWFERYATVFDTVEINNSFYRLPETATFHSWSVRAPTRFLFAVKASRFLTHMKKLKDPEQPLDLFFSRALALGRKLGPVLYQLPPGFKHNQPRLEAFLARLPPGVRHTVEFRDPSWYVPQVSAALARHNVALCLHDMPGSQTGRTTVGPFVYVRFHGSTAKYQGGYSDAQLARWAEWIADQLGQGTDVYAYFNNDTGGHAPRDAMTLRRQVAELLGNETSSMALERRFTGGRDTRSEAASRP